MSAFYFVWLRFQPCWPSKRRPLTSLLKVKADHTWNPTRGPLGQARPVTSSLSASCCGWADVLALLPFQVCAEPWRIVAVGSGWSSHNGDTLNHFSFCQVMQCGGWLGIQIPQLHPQDWGLGNSCGVTCFADAWGDGQHLLRSTRPEWEVGV